MESYINDSAMLHLINTIMPVPEFVKQAHVIDEETIPFDRFAYPEKRAFPIADPATTYLSFARYQVDKQRDSYPSCIRESIIKASSFWGINESILKFAKHLKQAEDAMADKEINSGYAYISKSGERHYPLHSPEHVFLASEHFPKHYKEYDIPTREKIATAIKTRAKECKVNIGKNTIIEDYSSTRACNTIKAATYIAARATARCVKQDDKDIYIKLGKGIIGSIDAHADLYKIASTLEYMDLATGAASVYGTTFPNAYNTIFNCDRKKIVKLASDVITLAGVQYQISDLATVSPAKWGAMLGNDLLAQISVDNSIDNEKLREILDTLPLPDKKAINISLSDMAINEDKINEILS